MFHSDQGAQYTSYIFRAHLKELHISNPFHTRTPYDNSVCESFFHTLKKEALYHHCMAHRRNCKPFWTNISISTTANARIEN